MIILLYFSFTSPFTVAFEFEILLIEFELSPKEFYERERYLEYAHFLFHTLLVFVCSACIKPFV